MGEVPLYTIFLSSLWHAAMFHSHISFVTVIFIHRDDLFHFIHLYSYTCRFHLLLTAYGTGAFLILQSGVLPQEHMLG